MRARGQKIVGRSCPIDKKPLGVLALNRCAPIFFAFILLGINSDQGRAQAADKDLIEGSPIEGRSGVVDSQVSGAGQLSELFYRIQVLQQDLKDLRGTIEEQSYLIKRLERSQKEQYLDLDNRLVQLGGADIVIPRPMSFNGPSAINHESPNSSATSHLNPTQAPKSSRPSTGR